MFDVQVSLALFNVLGHVFLAVVSLSLHTCCEKFSAYDRRIVVQKTVNRCGAMLHLFNIFSEPILFCMSTDLLSLPSP